MTCFRHPFLVRGTIYTRYGAFQIRRGLVDAPDAVGDECGWVRVDVDGDGVLIPSHDPTNTARPRSDSSRAT
jgi:hypothetical protein